MLMVMTTCPATGRMFWTGGYADPVSFEASVRAAGTVRCPHCQRQHTWSFDDAWLETGPAESYFDPELEAVL